MHFSRIVSSDLYAQKNHPTQEHLLPLFVAIGATGENFAPSGYTRATCIVSLRWIVCF
jgi:aromatic ring-opening dioxygenase catalytic subunit (LigB family)